MSERDDDFLSRWSRRKAESREGLKKKEDSAAEPEEPASADPEAPEQTARATPGEAPVGEEEDRADEETRPEAEETGENGFEDVDFDALNYNSDYTRFMGKDVPEAVRRRALRMLWQSNPILANIDGLNDYDEDFTDAAMVVKEFATNYKVGSGYLTEEERQAGYHDADEAEEIGDAEDAGDEAAPEETEVAAADDTAGTGTEPPAAGPDGAADETGSAQDDETV